MLAQNKASDTNFNRQFVELSIHSPDSNVLQDNRSIERLVSPDVLILSAGVGGGHNSAAKAIKESLEVSTSMTCLALDVLDLQGGMGRSLVNLRQELVTRFSALLHIKYGLTDNQLLSGLNNNFLPAILPMVEKLLERLVPPPESIIVTHHDVAHAVNAAVERGMLANTKLYVTVTDYHAHHSWYVPNERWVYFVPGLPHQNPKLVLLTEQ